MAMVVKIRARDLVAFLELAKRKTYAGDGPRVKKNYVRVYRYSAKRFFFEDRYIGNVVDTGVELVRFDGYPVWSMSYRGGMLPENQEIREEAFRFLKRALKSRPAQFPMRGPACFKRGHWIYKNQVRGTVLEFYGHESISFKNKSVYSRRYQGGLVHDKDYKVQIV